jgi:hypothetical protein
MYGMCVGSATTPLICVITLTGIATTPVICFIKVRNVRNVCGKCHNANSMFPEERNKQTDTADGQNIPLTEPINK